MVRFKSMPWVIGLVEQAVRKAGTAIVRTLDPAQQIKSQLDAAAVEADRELGQVSYAVVKALMASILGATPSEPAVDAFMMEVFNSPSGPARAFRLLGEARKTASDKRRRMLAAVFFGLPFTGIEADDRDRVDMLIERLVPDDIELLSTVARLEASELPRHGHPGCFVLTHGRQYLVGSSFIEKERHQDDDLKTAASLDGPAFTCLMSQGCLTLPSLWSADVTFNGVSANAEYLEITSLGRLLLRSLEDIRAGIEIGT